MAEGLQYAGDYLVEKLELVTSAGTPIDLRSLYMGLTLYEDIFSLTVTGTLTIHDSTNLTSLGPIIGQEYLYIKIRTAPKTPKFLGNFGGHLWKNVEIREKNSDKPDSCGSPNAPEKKTIA